MLNKPSELGCRACKCKGVCVYLGLAACALLDEAAGQGGRDSVALEKAADGVTETQSNQLLERPTTRQVKDKITVKTRTIRLSNNSQFNILPIICVCLKPVIIDLLT